MILAGSLSGMAAADSAIQKKIYGPGHPSDLALRTAALITSNKEMKDIIKIVKSLEESRLLIKGISKTNENKAKEQKGGFRPMLLQTLAASILGIALAGRGVIRAGERF